jgi:hypothetical protein
MGRFGCTIVMQRQTDRDAGDPYLDLEPTNVRFTFGTRHRRFATATVGYGSRAADRRQAEAGQFHSFDIGLQLVDNPLISTNQQSLK